MNSSRGLVLLTFLVVLTPWMATGSQPLPGGLADAGGRTGFVTMVRGQIEAIDLQTGDTLWASEKAHRALLVLGDRLYAWAKSGEGVRIVGLDLVAKGDVVLTTEPVPIPSWSLLADAPGQSFRWQTRVMPEYLEVHWEARAWAPESVPVTAEQRAEARKQVSGLIRVHLLTGKVQTTPTEYPQVPPALPPATIRESIRWSGTRGEWMFAVTVDQNSAGQSASLRTWLLKTNEELPARPLLRGRRLQVVAGLESRHLFLRDALPSPADTEAPPVEWHIWDLERGQSVGKVPYEPGTYPGTVIGGRAYFVKSDGLGGKIDRPFTQPRTLQAVDVRSGKVLWERPIEGKAVLPSGR